MTQDNAYAFSTFAAIGGTDYEGESFRSMRLFGSVDDAIDYARRLLNDRFDYAYVTGVHADGSLELKDVMRIADDEPSVVDLDWA